MSFVLLCNLSQILDFWGENSGPMTWRLTLAEVRHVLGLLVDFKLEAIAAVKLYKNYIIIKGCSEKKRPSPPYILWMKDQRNEVKKEIIWDNPFNFSYFFSLFCWFKLNVFYVLMAWCRSRK